MIKSSLTKEKAMEFAKLTKQAAKEMGLRRKPKSVK